MAPIPSRGIQVVAPYESYTDLGSLSHLLRTTSWRETNRLDSASGSILWFRDGDTLVWWQGGRGGREEGITVASDRLFTYLPALLGVEATSIGVVNPGAGGVLDAARKSSRGGVQAWVRGSADRLFLQLEAPGQVTADPSVRLTVGYGLAPGASLAHDVLLIDMPAPWQPGGISAWSRPAISRLAGGLPERGIAVFRVPLGQVAAPSLASLVQILATEFEGLEAWLDPSGSDHLLLVARHQAGLTEAGALFRAFTRPSIRQALAPAALRHPGDVLERFLLDREGLLAALRSDKAWSPPTAAILSGLRSRRGATVLPLAELSAGGIDLEAAIDFTTVPEDELEPLMIRLNASLSTRSDYLALLEAIAVGDGAEALALAGRIAQGSHDPTRDLRSLIQPWMDQGDRFAEQNLLEQAKAEFLIAVSFSPRDPDLNLRLAEVQRDLGELQKSRARYEDVHAQQPTSLQAALGLASVLERQGNFREGAELLEETEKLHPGEASVLINLGALHLRLAFGADEVAGKHIARARMLFQTAASLEPRLAEPHGGLAEVFTLLGEHERAMTEIDRAVTLEPNCTYRGWRGQILWELGRNEEAEQDLNKALLDCPEHLPALVALGGVLVDRGCYTQGREAWERAIQLGDEVSAARVNLEQLKLAGVEEALGDSQCQ
jgi:tetratricopeptide (TPR) repeat protein